MLKKILIGMCCVMIAFTIFACGTNNQSSKEIAYRVAFEGSAPIDNSQNHDLEKLVNTYAEWNEIFDKREYLGELEYDEQFFIDKSLIVYAFTKTIGTLEIQKVKKLDEQLMVEVSYDEDLQDIVMYGITIIEVKKMDIVNTNTLQIVQK